jgi:hypothetical protein
VVVVTGVLYGVMMARRMSRYWPGAEQLSGRQRVTVAGAARRGERVGDPGLAQAVVDYSDGMRAAAQQAKPYRWVLPLVLVVSIATALWDAAFGSWGNAIASVVYLGALLIEWLWWPRRRDQLLANVGHAADIHQR